MERQIELGMCLSLSGNFNMKVMNPSEMCFLICNGCKNKATFLKKLKADCNWGSVAVMHFGIFCLLFKNMMIEIF
jgi:hypothetical protein